MDSWRRITACLFVTVLAAVALPQGAWAQPSSLVTRPGKSVSFRVPTSGAHTCIVRGDGKRASATVDGAAGVQIAFRVAARARRGPWRLSVACSPGVTRRLLLTVVRTRRATGRLVSGPIHIRVAARVQRPAPRPAAQAAPAAPSVAGPMSEADALARAHADWATYGAAYLAVFRNGQCTDWAAQKRPDIVEQATVRLWADHYMGLPDLGISWDGGSWDNMARAARLPVGTIPKAGAVVAFDPGTLGASAPTGHVAYVESVDDGGGTFTVSEMNAPVPWQVTYRTIPAAAIAQGGITFVY
jgi:surface antigen